MAKTGPQRYPGASTAYWYGSKYQGSAMESNVIVWHSTEGTSLPSYGGGANAPNFTAKPDFAAKRLVWYQHFDFDVSSRALANKAGGVQTNTLNVVQVEIVGTCDPATHRKWGSTPHLYTPELPDWAIRDLAAFAKWAHDNHGIPLTSEVAFKAYPSSYGSNGVRMSASRWSDFTGHCGHQHVPENDHGDPGLFPMAAILARAKGDAGTKPEPPKEDTMPTAEEIAEAVWQHRIENQFRKDASGQPRRIPAQDFLEYGDSHHDDVMTKLDALAAANTELVKAVATLAAGIGDLDPTAIITELKDSLESITVRLDVPDAP